MADSSTIKLGRSTMSGMMWATSGTGLQLVMRIVVLAVLARLLTPADFGIVTTGLLIVGLAEQLTMLGVGPAIVQRSELEERHIRTAFYSSLILGCLGAGFIWLGIPLISRFFGIEELHDVLPILILLFPLRSLSVVSENLLQRNLQFKKLALVDVLSYFLAYGMIGTALAIVGLRVWALVIATLADALFKAILMYGLSPHSMRPMLEWRAAKELFSFGGGFTLTGILGFVALKGDYLVVGKWLGAGALGLYERAYNLMTTFVSLFGKTLDKVLFPNMAKVQHDKKRLSVAYRHSITGVALLLLPISVVVVIVAPELVRTLLGEQWVEAVAPLQILALGMVFRTSTKISNALAKATGIVYRIAWREGVYAFLILVGALVGQFWGITGVAWGVLGALFVQFLMFNQMVLVQINLPWKMLWRAHKVALLPTLTVGSVTWGGTYLLGGRMGLPAPWVLIGTGMALLVIIGVLIRFFPVRFLGREGFAFAQAFYRNVPFKIAFLESALHAPAKQALYGDRHSS